MKRTYVTWLPALGLFLLLLWQAEGARNGALWGVSLCGELLIPSLLPFFAAVGLLTRLGLTEEAGRLLSPGARRLFGISGAGATAFLLGLSGGYPLGAAAVAELLRSRQIEREEARRLLRFCDNTGPSFAVGALGVGVFSSPAAGLFLWGIHILSAILTGVLLSFPRVQTTAPGAPSPTLPSFGEAFTASVKAAASALLGICAFVIFFSAIFAALDALGLINALAGRLSVAAGAELGVCRALLAGALELSGGVGAMRGLAVTPGNLALGAFLLSWGGLCVHCQAMAVLGGTGLDAKGRLGGKLLQGVLAAGLAYLLAPLVV